MTADRTPRDFLAASATLSEAVTNVVVGAWMRRWPGSMFPIVLSARVPLAVSACVDRGATPEQIVDAATAVPTFASTYASTVRTLAGTAPEAEQSADAAMDALVAYATGTPLGAVLDELLTRASAGRTDELANTPNAEQLLADLLGATPLDPRGSP